MSSSRWGIRLYVAPNQWLNRKRKILRGAYRTFIRKEMGLYNPTGWYDRHYSQGISDRQTIEPDTHVITASYHYASIEFIILREIYNNRFSIEGKSVLDVGSGAGHWLDFYKSLGAKLCVGIDVSEVSSNFLKEKFASEGVEIHQGLIQDFLGRDNRQYDLINAIGVMFHVVDDSEWLGILKSMGNSLREGGLLVVGGHFGLLNNVNVQYDGNNLAYKRLRSKRNWKQSLKSFGFKEVKVCKNPGYLQIKDYVPENNILLAWR